MRNFYCVHLQNFVDSTPFYIVCPSYTDAWDELRRLEREIDDEDVEYHVIDLSSDEIRSIIDSDENSVEYRYPLSQDSLDD